MAPSPAPVENNGETTTTTVATPTLESQRSIPTPFLTKTYNLVDDKSIDEVISWNEDGSTFIVWNPTVFASNLLPKYFKHNNFSSFVRQLNTYVNSIISSSIIFFYVMFFVFCFCLNLN